MKLTAEYVTVLDGNQAEITKHRRLYGDTEQESMQWLPYLKYIARKPRSLRNSGIYGMMPDTMQKYLDGCGAGDCGTLLKTLAELTERTGFESAIQTVNQAVLYQANDCDSLKNLYRQLFADVPELPPLPLQSGVPDVGQVSSGLSEYDSLLEGGWTA